MRHSEQATAVARDTGWDLDDYASERGWSGVGIGPVGESRDSDALPARIVSASMQDYGIGYRFTSKGGDPLGGGAIIVRAEDEDAACRTAYATLRARLDDIAPRGLVSILDVTPQAEYFHGGSRHICNLLDAGCRS